MPCGNFMYVANALVILSLKSDLVNWFNHSAHSRDFRISKNPKEQPESVNRLLKMINFYEKKFSSFGPRCSRTLLCVIIIAYKISWLGAWKRKWSELNGSSNFSLLIPPSATINCPTCIPACLFGNTAVSLTSTQNPSLLCRYR